MTQRYLQALLAASPEFQVGHGYAASKYSEDALKLASKWVGNRFGCVSLTLEMPFKDHDDAADPRQGWSPERSAQLGKDCMGALLEWFVEREKK